MTNSISVRTAGHAAGVGRGFGTEVLCRGNAFVTRVRLVDGLVDEVWSTGRMVRNMDVLLRGKLDDCGRPDFVHQAHCLCNDGHALAAIRAVEDMAGVVLPHSAVLVRRLVQSLRCIQEHLLHFYQFHISDWADLDAALLADPSRAASLASSPGEDRAHFLTVGKQLQGLAKAQGEIGIRSGPGNGYPGAEELHLLLYGHALEALRVGAGLRTALELLDCGPKGFRAYRIGGLPDDLNLDGAVLERLRTALEDCREFVETVFPHDVKRLAGTYASWAELGSGHALLTWDELLGNELIIPDSAGGWLLSPPDGTVIREEREPNWNGEDRGRYRLFADGNEPRFRWGKGSYFWLPAPRHDAFACEVGPLARVLGGGCGGNRGMEYALRTMLGGCGLPMSAMNSTMGRILARGIECAALMRSLPGLVDELEGALAGEASHRVDFSLPSAGIGVGRVEVPRGTLTHTLRWGNGRILNHDYLIPSLWNFSPRDTDGRRGPLERALVGTPVADAEHPVEVLRTLHQLDPCNVCHVVIENRDTGRITMTTA